MGKRASDIFYCLLVGAEPTDVSFEDDVVCRARGQRRGVA